MPTITEPRKRGRPAPHPVDRIRTRLWFSALREISGLRSAYAIELALDHDYVRKRKTDVARPRKWDSYAQGKKIPLDGAKSNNAIERAEELFPGAARYFRSPLWQCLKKEALDARAIEDALLTLEPTVVAVLFEAKPREKEARPRTHPFDDDCARQLIALASFDALVAAALLAGLAEVIASPELRERALHVYVEIQAPLRELAVMAGIYEELFSLIDSRYKHWIFLASNQRMEMVLFWQGVAAGAK